MDDLHDALGRRLAVSSLAPCPVEFTAALVNLCSTQSCGKCTPCRVGLSALSDLLADVLEGRADESTLSLIERTARTIYLSSDCAIGYEAGAMALTAIRGFRDDFEHHIREHSCGFDREARVPCVSGCPAHVDIPGYISLVEAGRYADAVKVIRKNNPLPLVCGLVCEHPCEMHCRRGMVDDPMNILALKRFAVEHSDLNDHKPHVVDNTGKRVAVIGGGPAGLATAFFLTRAGVPVTIFEARDSLGGVVRHVIPEFRIASDDISHDAELCLAFGVKVQLNARVESIDELKAQGFTDVVVATGAWMPCSAGLGEGAELDVLEFLEAAKKGEKLELGEDVVVIGAGNTAMDAARVAKRLAGVKNVRLVYRRTKKQMPADEEELDLALADGVEFCELLAPKALNGAVLTCDVMELGEPDASGRRSPFATGETVELSATTVICAVGEGIDASLYDAAGVEHDRRGRLAATSTGIEGVWAAGDCRRGPATVVEAIADAAEVARAIAGVDFNKYADCNEQTGREDTCYERKGSLCRDKRNCTKTRCLGCGSVCEVCCDVCPNRANVAIKVPGLAKHQVVHIDGMCNECGNCAVFCPYQEGRPYKDKLTLFWSEQDMENSENEGFLAVDEDRFKVRVAGTVRTVSVDAVNTGLPEAVRLTIRAVRDNYSYLLKK